MEHNENRRYTELTTAPVNKLLFRMAAPAIAGMLVSSVYSMTDTFFISLLRNNSLTAAIGIVFSFMSLVQAAGFLFGHGSGNYMARRLGKQDMNGAEAMAANGFLFSLSAGVIIAILGLIYRRLLVALLGGSVSPELEQACISYLTVLLPAVPAMTASLTLNNQLRLQGSAAEGMKGMGVGMVVNVILDPIFIFGLKLGLVGAGLATLLGQYAGLFTLLVIARGGENVKIDIRKARITPLMMKELFGGGFPNLARQGITTVAEILLNRAAGAYGDETIAAFTITSRIYMIGFAVIIGFGHGFQPICGFNWGAGLYTRVKQAFSFCMKTTTAFLVLMGAAILVFAPGLMRIFTDDIVVMEAGVKILRYQCTSVAFLGYYTMTGMLLQNSGKFLKATLVSVFRQGVFFLPLILILPRLLGLDGVMLSQPVADICAFAATLPFGIRAIRELKTENEKK